MADLGTLTSLIISRGKRSILVDYTGFKSRKLSSAIKKGSVQTWSVLQGDPSSGEKLLIPPSPGTLSGRVTSGGINDANYLVHLFYRPTGTLLETKKTNSDGTFSFSFHLNKNEGAAYTIVAIDLTKTYNAIVYDLLTPG